jgi:hypothetical protein
MDAFSSICIIGFRSILDIRINIFEIMKHSISFIGIVALCILLFSSCSFTCLPGEGAIITQEIDLDLITGVHLDSSVDIELRYGKHQKVEVSGHANHIALLSKTVSGDTWTVDFKENICTDDFKVYITLPLIARVDIDGSGDVHSATPMQAEDLDLEIDGSGNINLQLSASHIHVRIDGSGDVTLKGNAQSVDADIEGSGNFYARNIEVEDADVSIDGSGDAIVTVSDKLDASIRGSGSIKYTGNPKVSSSIKGSGEVIKD